MTTILTHPTAARERSDAELVTAMRHGSMAAFDAVVGRYQAALTGYARQILGGSQPDAEEVVQDAFMRALAALRRDTGREIALKPWLYAITRNASLDRLRRTHHTVDLQPLEAVLHGCNDDPVAAVEQREQLHLIVGGLAGLPERQRAALVMHELEGRTHEEMAARLGVSIGASKALVCRARQSVAHLRVA